MNSHMFWNGRKFAAKFIDDIGEFPLFVTATNDPDLAESFYLDLLEAARNRYAICKTVEARIVESLEIQFRSMFLIERLHVAWVNITAGEPEYDTLPSIDIAIDLYKSNLSQSALYLRIQRMLDAPTWEVEMFGES